jgi:hypothetical protein
VALVAGLDPQRYLRATSWERIVLDAAATRALVIKAQNKKAEIDAIGVSVAQTVAKLFSS